MKTFSRFVFVGIANTALGLIIILIARLFLDEYSANLLAYLILVPLSFLAHRRWSFQDRGRPLQAFLRYLPTVAVGYLLNLAVLKSSLAAGVGGVFAQVAAIAAYVGFTYLFSKHKVFRHQSS